jgi:hypothetical protein
MEEFVLLEEGLEKERTCERRKGKRGKFRFLGKEECRK